MHLLLTLDFQATASFCPLMSSSSPLEDMRLTLDANQFVRLYKCTPVINQIRRSICRRPGIPMILLTNLQMYRSPTTNPLTRMARDYPSLKIITERQQTVIVPVSMKSDVTYVSLMPTLTFFDQPTAPQEICKSLWNEHCNFLLSVLPLIRGGKVLPACPRRIISFITVLTIRRPKVHISQCSAKTSMNECT